MRGVFPWVRAAHPRVLAGDRSGMPRNHPWVRLVRSLAQLTRARVRGLRTDWCGRTSNMAYAECVAILCSRRDECSHLEQGACWSGPGPLRARSTWSRTPCRYCSAWSSAPCPVGVRGGAGGPHGRSAARPPARWDVSACSPAEMARATGEFSRLHTPGLRSSWTHERDRRDVHAGQKLADTGIETGEREGVVTPVRGMPLRGVPIGVGVWCHVHAVYVAGSALVAGAVVLAGALVPPRTSRRPGPGCPGRGCWRWWPPGSARAPWWWASGASPPGLRPPRVPHRLAGRSAGRRTEGHPGLRRGAQPRLLAGPVVLTPASVSSAVSRGHGPG
jgi:hypothetical protein